MGEFDLSFQTMGFQGSPNLRGGLVGEESGGDGRKQEEGGQVAEEFRIGQEVEVSGAKKIWPGTLLT